MTEAEGTGGHILAGVKVVDMTQYLAGPTVTRLLAEMGADIIKIEQAPHGDPSRHYAIVNDGRSGYFVQQNRGKKSLCIDFDDPAGREVLDALLAEADIFVENYGPGVLERRGLDWASVSAGNPRLIMASVSGFGKDSAYSDRPAFDMIAQAFSGLMWMTGEPDGPPMPVGTSIGDVSAGVHAATAIGFALFHRERTGQGQHLDISMIDVLFHMHEVGVQGPHLTGMRWRPKRAGHRSALNAPLGAFEGPDGWIVLQVMDGQWSRFCAAMGRPDLEVDERFNSLRVRQKNRHELNAIIEEWVAGQPSNEVLLQLLADARVPSAPVMEPAAAGDNPYFTSRGAVRTVPDPILGEITIPGDPLRFGAHPEPLDLLAPTLGQHNAEILERLGYTAEQAADLHERGVLRSADT